MKSFRIGELDLLRFLAALAVVVFHYGFRGHAADDLSLISFPAISSMAKYGYLGVHLFFMISGFVILRTAGQGDVRKFVRSRIVRLYPAFWICCTLTFVASVIFGGDRFPVSFKQYLVNMTLLSGFVGVQSIDGAYWSLFVEIKFYFLIFLVLCFKKIDKIELLLKVWILTICILQVLPIGKLRYLFIADYGVFFIAGCFFYIVWLDGMTPRRGFYLCAVWLLSLLQTVSGLDGFRQHYQTEISSLVVLVIVSSFYVVFLLVSFRRTWLLGNISWPTLGAVTYPLYLIHQNIGYIAFNALYGRASESVIFWSVFLLALVLALLICRFAERPLATLINSLIKRRF